MRLCTKERIVHLLEDKILTIQGANPGEIFLDDARIALRLRPQILEIQGPVNIADPDESAWTRYDLAQIALMPGRFYLATSVESFSLPSTIMGLICTRSKYARRGLELAQSSVYVTPGFGVGAPAPLVFEIYPRVELRGLQSGFPYGFLLLFELDENIKAGDLNYGDRFPLNIG